MVNILIFKAKLVEKKLITTRKPVFDSFKIAL